MFMLPIGGTVPCKGLKSTFGAAASLVILLVWVYYPAQSVRFGAELTCEMPCLLQKAGIAETRKARVALVVKR